MTRFGVVLALVLAAGWARAEVFVSVRDAGGSARIEYECTAGEIVRAFALDVTVDNGKIVGISDFFVGASRTDHQGYGVFPAAFREHVTVLSGTEADWSAPVYTPIAVPTDAPAGTLPGLGSTGVTLELGGVWDVSEPAAVPGPTGVLCALEISDAADVSIAPNLSRGGVLSASTGTPLTPVCTGATVTPLTPRITGLSVQDGLITVTFRDGELETAPSPAGEWTPTGNTTGLYTEQVGEASLRFYRVSHSP